jgi:hypothetical protein
MNGTQLVVSAVALVALGHTLVDYGRMITNLGDAVVRKSFIAQTVAFVVFVLLVFVAAQATDSFGALQIMGDKPLSDLGWASLLLIGLALGGGGGVLTKAIQARDNTQSAAQPPFVGGPTVPEV